jgi:hypothetical protein
MCVKDEVIDAYLLHRLSEAEEKEFEEHFFNCRKCFRRVEERDELLTVIKTRGAEIFPKTTPRVETRPSLATRFLDFFTPRQWVFVTLTVIALLVIVFGYMPGRRPAPPRFVLDGENIVRGETLTLISPVIDVRSVPVAFEWRPLDGAADYKVSLYDENLIWSASTKETRIALPADVQSKLEPGRKYSWQVKAFSPQGLLVSVSSRVHFQISR